MTHCKWAKDPAVQNMPTHDLTSVATQRTTKERQKAREAFLAAWHP